MNRSRLLTTIAAATLGVSLLGACGAIAERAVEFGVERAVEADTGENFDLDLSDNGISFSTDEGDFALNVDGDQGTIVYDSEDGSGVIQFDENGAVLNSDQGNGTLSFDDDSASVTFEDEDGAASIWGINRAFPEGWSPLIGQPAAYAEESAIIAINDAGDRTVYSANLQEVDASYPVELDQRLRSNGFDAEVAENLPGLTTYTNDGNSIEVIVSNGNVTVLAKLVN